MYTIPQNRFSAHIDGWRHIHPTQPHNAQPISNRTLLIGTKSKAVAIVANIIIPVASHFK